MRLLALATAQRGVVALRQLLALGYSAVGVRRLAAREGWTRLGRGVWALPGAAASWERDLQVALLVAGERSAVAGLSALTLHELVRRASRPPLELLVPHDRAPQCGVRGARITRTRTLVTSDVVTVDRLRVTTVERTLCDVAGRRDDRWLRDRVAAAVREGLTTGDAVRHRLERLRGLQGTDRLRRVLDQLEGVDTDSGSEWETLAWLRAEGLAPDTTQHPIRCSDGVTVHADLAWIPERVSVEYLGDRWHSLPSAVATDAVRTNGVVTVGWLQLLLTREQLRRRDRRFLRQLRHALASRGDRFA